MHTHGDACVQSVIKQSFLHNQLHCVLFLFKIKAHHVTSVSLKLYASDEVLNRSKLRSY